MKIKQLGEILARLKRRRDAQVERLTKSLEAIKKLNKERKK